MVAGASSFARELEEAQFELLRRSELHQEAVLRAVANKANAEPARQIEEGEMVLAKRGGLGQRPKDKLQSKYTGPYVVVDRPDPSHSIVKIVHLATRKVESRHMNELVVCNMSQFREVQDAIPFALQDEWTYQVDKILEHRPVGPRRINGRTNKNPGMNSSLSISIFRCHRCGQSRGLCSLCAFAYAFVNLLWQYLLLGLHARFCIACRPQVRASATARTQQPAAHRSHPTCVRPRTSVGVTLRE